MKDRYGPYLSGTGHLFYTDVYPDGRRRSVWLHREKMERHLKRQLRRDEVVHHIDGNRTNNVLSNLRVMAKADHARHHARPPEMVTFACAECGLETIKRARNVAHNRKQKKAGPFCSRHCSGTRNARLRRY